MLFVALLILVLTLYLVNTRPQNLSEAWYAVIGASLMLLFGLVHLSDLLEVGRQLGPVLVFLLAMMATGYLADKAGVFDAAAQWAIQAARGHGLRLYVLIFLLGAFLTVTLSLDTTAVVLAPIVYSLTRQLGIDPLPFVLA